MWVEVLMADDIQNEAFPTAGSAAVSFSLEFGPIHPLLPLSVRLKPIVAQATEMNVMVTLLLFSLSIKSHKQFTVCLSGTPPLYLLPVVNIKPPSIPFFIICASFNFNLLCRAKHRHNHCQQFNYFLNHNVI